MQRIAQFIRENERFLITSHSRPDGDSIGTALALAEALRIAGKTVHIVNADPAPGNYKTLPGLDTIEIASTADGEYDALIILECGDLERSGVSGLERYYCINIDHHLKNDNYGQLNWVDPTAAAVAEMIFKLIRELGIPISADVATNLYVAILTDTGSFQFSNTTAATFRIASELVDAGASPELTSRAVLMSQPESKLRLLAKLLNTLDFDESRKISWIKLDRKILEETGAAPNDTEGIVNYPLSVEGVQICAFFREEGERFFRVSLRSKGEANVSVVAERFGGGGHRNAAGLSIEGTFEDVRKQIVDQLTLLLV